MKPLILPLAMLAIILAAVLVFPYPAPEAPPPPSPSPFEIEMLPAWGEDIIQRQADEIQTLKELVRQMAIDRGQAEPAAASVSVGPLELEPLGAFRITGYCPCETCCGEWAKNRPILGDREIVLTSCGAIAREGITVSADPDVIPLGSKLYIEGYGVRVTQDTGSAVKGRVIDLYFDRHEDAMINGVGAVWLISEGE